MRYDALLFDLDGTLLNTSNSHINVSFVSAGRIIPGLQYEQFEKWYRMLVPVEVLCEEHGLHPQMADVMRSIREELYEKFLREEADWHEDATHLLKLVDHFPKGIVTNTQRSHTDILNEKLNLSSRFSVIITRDDVPDKTKPHPAGLLMAADSLKIVPSRCFYIGDEGRDIDAASAAGMESCFVRRPKTPLDGIDRATHVVSSLSEVTQLLM